MPVPKYILKILSKTSPLISLRKSNEYSDATIQSAVFCSMNNEEANKLENTRGLYKFIGL